MDSSAVPDTPAAAGLAAVLGPDLDPMLEPALRLDRDSAWFGHVPFAAWVVEAARPRLLVELGTHNGASFLAFCEAVRRQRLDTRCYAVDSWAGDPQAGFYGEEVFAELATVHARQYSDFSHLLRCSFDEALRHFDDGSVDLLHIDGLHTFEAVRHDFESWRPKLSDRAVVLFHDTAERQGEFGVWRLWAELSRQFPFFEFSHGHGLGVLCVGPRAPDAVLALTRLEPEAAGRARRLFAALGDRWDGRHRELQALRTLDARDERIRQLDARTGALERELAAGSAERDAAVAEAERTALALTQAQGEAATAIVAAAAAAARADGQLTALEEARARVLELREKVAPLFNEHAARVAAEGEVAALRAERDLLLRSTSWRVTGPVRRLARMTPARWKRQARRAARMLFWLVTPWRIPLRLRVRRQAILHWQEVARQNPPPLPPPADANESYARWMAAFEPAHFVQIGEDRRPSIAVLLPTAGQDDRTAATLDSLRGQAEADWTLVVPDLPDARAAVAALGEDRRLVLAPCPPEAERGTVLAALLAAAPGQWGMVLDSGDVLPAGALKWLSMAVASEPRAAAVYADEDLLGAENRRIEPQFKPAWSPELLLSYNYLGHPTLLALDLARECGGFRPGSGAGAEWDLNLRLGDAAAAGHRPIRRLPAVLCHRPASTDRERPVPGTRAAGEHRAALAGWLEAGGLRGVEVRTEPDGTCRAGWEIAEPPLVSVIIPNRNSPSLLRRCLKGVLERTDYRAVEVVIVENNSDDPETLAMYRELPRLGRVRVVEKEGAFNYSAACNLGARHARGSLLLFLNNDVEVREAGWLGELVRLALRPGVGVVGTALRYPDGTLQHAGVAAGPHLLGLMFHRTAREAEWGVFGSPGTTRNWSAVMGACQMVRRACFDQVGGFDEVFELANSDIVLCLRAGQLGFRTAYTPFAALTHHEGATRGHENPAVDMARSVRELRRLGLEADPFFHPGLSGNDPVPRLRAPGEPSGEDALRALSERFLAEAPHHGRGLDLMDDAAVLAAADLPRAHVIPAQRADEPVEDEWMAAGWVITLLRSRADLRIRFPLALTEGGGGAFASWLAAGTEGEMSLPPGLAEQLPALWARKLETRPRQVYFWRDDVHWGHPVGMLPPGYAAYLRYLFRDGQFEYGLRLEEAWWVLLSAAERPAAELVRAWRFNVEWQERHPLALTVFGAASFAAWFAERFGVDSGTGWLDPAAWPDLPAPAEQLRLAYARNPAWHGHDIRTEEGAAGLLRVLAAPEGGQTRAVRDWCAAQAAAGLARAVSGPAVNVLGHFCYPSGLRVSVEAASDAMELAGVSVSRRDIRTHLNDHPPHTSFGGLESADITLLHTQPGDLFLKAYERADLAPRRPRTFRIGYWYWELDEAPEEWGAIAEHADEVWTATEFVAEALRAVVRCPVRVMFPGVRIGAFTPVPRERLGAPARGEDGRFAFLFSFHMASITERKNPMGLVRAFRRAFAPHEKVDLVIKTTSEARHEKELAELRTAVLGHNITVIDAVLSPNETLALMDGCDAYVSLHRAEGLGLGMAEAMLLGKPVIASRYSGNLQFMDDGNSLLVDCAVAPIGREIKPYKATARWAEPSVEHAARLMRQLFEDQDGARALGRRAQDSARRSMSAEAAGRRMAARLAEIAAEGRPRA